MPDYTTKKETRPIECISKLRRHVQTLQALLYRLQNEDLHRLLLPSSMTRSSTATTEKDVIDVDDDAVSCWDEPRIVTEVTRTLDKMMEWESLLRTEGRLYQTQHGQRTSLLKLFDDRVVDVDARVRGALEDLTQTYANLTRLQSQIQTSLQHASHHSYFYTGGTDTIANESSNGALLPQMPRMETFDAVLEYANLLSRSACPPAWDPSRPLGAFKAPSVQEHEMRSSLLFKLNVQRERALRSGMGMGSVTGGGKGGVSGSSDHVGQEEGGERKRAGNVFMHVGHAESDEEVGISLELDI